MTKPPFSRDDSITADARRWDPNRAARFTDAAAGTDAGRGSPQRSNPSAESLAACLSDVCSAFQTPDAQGRKVATVSYCISTCCRAGSSGENLL